MRAAGDPGPQGRLLGELVDEVVLAEQDDLEQLGFGGRFIGHHLQQVQVRAGNGLGFIKQQNGDPPGLVALHQEGPQRVFEVLKVAGGGLPERGQDDPQEGRRRGRRGVGELGDGVLVRAATSQLSTSSSATVVLPLPMGPVSRKRPRRSSTE